MSENSSPWSCLPSLADGPYAHLMRRAALECCKWHTQVEDRPIFCPFPLVLEGETWLRLRGLAEALAAESLQAERELLGRPELHERLGLPRWLRQCLQQISRSGPSPSGPRVVRFDFHWTSQGWRISEANADVAGGFIEASGVTQLLNEHYPGYRRLGDPAGALSEAARRRVGPEAVVGLMHMTVYSEDRQVMLYLAKRFEESGLVPHPIGPEQLRCVDGCATATDTGTPIPLKLVYRFLPAHWLDRLPNRAARNYFFAGSKTPICNPGYAVLTQSKRFPLTWDALSSPLPTWRALLPETRSPDRVEGKFEDGWVLKPALGFEGYNVGMLGIDSNTDWREIRDLARRDPSVWAAQRRFELLPVQTPEGPLYPCLGIYTIDGCVAGAYCRIAQRPLIDDRSREIAVLVQG